MTIPAAVQDAYASPQPGTIIRDLLEFSHSDFTATLYIVNDNGAFVYSGNTYQPYPFQYVYSPLAVGENPPFQVAISNVSAIISDRMLEALGSENEPIEMVFRQVVSVGGSDYVHEFDLPLYVADFRQDAEFITITAYFHNMMGQSFPFEVFTVERFPGLGS